MAVRNNLLIITGKKQVGRWEESSPALLPSPQSGRMVPRLSLHSRLLLTHSPHRTSSDTCSHTVTLSAMPLSWLFYLLGTSFLTPSILNPFALL